MLVHINRALLGACFGMLILGNSLQLFRYQSLNLGYFIIVLCTMAEFIKHIFIFAMSYSDPTVVVQICRKQKLLMYGSPLRIGECQRCWKFHFQSCFMQRVVCYKNNVSQETLILKDSATNVCNETLEVWEMICPYGIAYCSS